MKQTKTPMLLWLIAASVSIAARGQTMDCSNSRSQSPAIPVSQASSDYDRPVSWKLLLPNILCDQKNIWFFPVRIPQDDNWVPALGVSAATAGLFVLDPIEGRYFHGTSAYTGFNNVLTSTGSTLATILVPSSMYLAGWLHQDTKMEHTALLAGEAVADAEILTTVLKDVTSRKRPYSFSSHQTYGDSFYDREGSKVIGGGGFPSGHTIAAFSIATVISHRYKQHRWVPYVAFGAAAAIGFSRLSLSQHFVSDVFVGAALGYATSRFAVLRY